MNVETAGACSLLRLSAAGQAGRRAKVLARSQRASKTAVGEDVGAVPHTCISGCIEIRIHEDGRVAEQP